MSGRPQSADAVVVGAGIIGLAVAWQAARRGLAVTVLERDAIGAGSTHEAAGMLAPVAEADPSEPGVLELGIASARAYPEFIADLRAATPFDPGYLPCGTLLVARDGDEAAALDRALALRERLGLEATRLRPSQARALEPALAPALRLAGELPHDHAVDPRTLVAALADALARAGGVVREGTAVEAVLSGSGRVSGVRLAGGEEVACEQVAIAAGVWSNEIAGTRPAGETDEPGGVPLRPVKGQILRLRDPAGPGLVKHVLRSERMYLVPRGDGRYVLGATVEERGFDRTVTAGAMFELLRALAELVPGSRELVVEELSAGLRPAAPDNEPVLGRGSPEGLVWATGHYRGGVLLAPITARLIAGLLAGDAPDPALDRFGVSRFTGVPA